MDRIAQQALQRRENAIAEFVPSLARNAGNKRCAKKSSP